MRRWRELRPGKSNYVVSQSLKHTKLAQDNGGLGVQDSQLFAKAAMPRQQLAILDTLVDPKFLHLNKDYS